MAAQFVPLLMVVLALGPFSSYSATRWPPLSTVTNTSNITKVYLVSSCHLDLGYGDSLLDTLNYYFDQVIPGAITIARQLKGGPEALVYTTHPYLAWLYTHCTAGRGLHCPTRAELERFSTAVRDGDLVWHAFPFNAQPEVYDAELATFGFQLMEELAAEFPYRPLAMSQRDVPGLTRSLVPIMAGRGVRAVTVGVNAASMPPAVPTAFRWRDAATGAWVVGMWHPHGYGGERGVSLQSSVLVEGLESALAFAIDSDNAGPPPLYEIAANFERLRTLFPNAKIVASGYNEFVKELVDHKDLLPEVTLEIGDTWIYGVGSDPWKTAQFRALMRARKACLADGKCSLTSDDAFFNFSFYLLKYGEHTWGYDVDKYLHDYTNWLNPDFQKQLSTDNYQSMIASWVEQRDWSIKYSLESITPHHPLSQYVANELNRLKFNGSVSLHGFERHDCGSFSPKNSRVTLHFDTDTMSISSLTDQRGGASDGIEYAGGEYRLAQLVYKTYSALDMDSFVEHYAFDFSIDNPHKDFGKPGLPDTVKHSQSTAHALPASCFARDSTFLMQGSFARELVGEYGAPAQVWLEVTLPDETLDPQRDTTINITVYLVNKTATRLPESLSVAFQPNPQAVDVNSLSISKLGQYVGVLDIVKNGSKHVHCADDGGVAYGQPGFKVVAWDTNLVSVGGANVLPVPMETPDLMGGFSFNIFNNLWNTNYIMWYPFLEEDKSSKYRFTLILPKRS